MKKVRESNIELLRILAMLGVVLLHFNGSPGQALSLADRGSLNYWILLTVENIAICAVNLFLLITGYFSATSQKRDLSKVLLLILQVIAFRLAITVVSLVFDGFSLSKLLESLLPCNYFVMQYAAVYLLSPYLNLALQKLSDAGRRKCLIVSLLVLSVYPTMVDILQNITHIGYPGLSTVAAGGSGYGYTLINFLLMYMIGACLRLNQTKWSAKLSSLVYIGCIAVLTVWNELMPDVANAYSNPLVILQAISLFLLMRNCTFSSPVINRLATGTFTCFLFHGYLFRFVDVKYAVQSNPLVLILIMLATAVGCYLISWVISEIYHFLETPVRKGLCCLTRRISLTPEETDNQSD